MKKAVDFVIAHGYTIMLSGFAIIAITGLLMVRAMTTSGRKDLIYWYIIGFGAAIYLIGRIGIALKRKQLRREHEARMAQEARDSDDDEEATEGVKTDKEST